jgi:hypothetical protein
MMNTRLALSLAVACVMAFPGAAAVRKQKPNPLSPEAETSVMLGGNKVTVEYSAPSARGRKVEGGLVPYDSVWRAGADSATTLITDADIMVGDLMLSKGMYTLYVAAAPGGWKLIVNKQTGQWGTVYQENQDLGRASMTLKTLGTPVETFKINLAKVDEQSANLTLTWGTTTASVPVKLAH